jgi:hypothetical protein
LNKFEDILTNEDLIAYFEGRKFEEINLEEKSEKNNSVLDNHVLFSELQEKVEKELKNFDYKTIGKTDAHFSETIYEYLKDFPRRELTDIRFWQSLSLNYLQNYIWLRWYKTENLSKNNKIKNDEKINILKSKDNKSLFNRFLGGTSLKSLTSRQAISRLFWPRHILKDKKLVELCFEKQDIAVAVFERQYGMNPEAAIAFIKNISIKHSSLEKKKIQLEAKILNRYFATISPDYLNQNSIKKLLFI